MDRSMLTGFVTLVLVIKCTGWIGSLAATRVALVDNGYVDLVVAISEAAPESQAEVIISNIKVFTLLFDIILCS